MNQFRDERPLYGQGCLSAAMLVIAVAYRNFWISRFEGWHVLPSRGYAKRFRDSRRVGPSSRAAQAEARAVTRLVTKRWHDGDHNDRRHRDHENPDRETELG
jgi:hypothetical protein